MRVLVTGAYGLIGSACLARLHADGHDLVAAGRALAAARRRYPYARWIAADFAQLGEAAAWQPLLTGVDAVVNCVGVLQDGARDNMRRVQSEGTKALFDACVRAAVTRVVHISAIGAEPDGPSAFARTKAEAEAYLRTRELDWVILRPALLISPAVYGGSAMLRALAAFPGFVPVIRAEASLQVVSADDLAETVARSLAPGAPARVTWDVAHPQIHRLTDIVMATRAWLGFAPCRVLRLPDTVATAVARAADLLGWLGWRSPARSTSLAQLAVGVVGDPRPWMSATGIRPQSLGDMLAARPSNVQDRWFARLYLLKPLAIAGLGLGAIATGVLHLAAYGQLAAILWQAGALGLAAAAAPGLLVGAAAVAAGLGVLVRATARVALLVLIGLAGLQILDHALGSGAADLVALDVAAMLAMLFALAILDDR
jgi:uncharacterized protein YbjT (DUF2867 family)